MQDKILVSNKCITYFEYIKYMNFSLDRMLYCKACKGYKGRHKHTEEKENLSEHLAPRSEHCSKCGRCVLKMCHHCSVLNVCIGHYNQVRDLNYNFDYSDILLEKLRILSRICTHCLYSVFNNQFLWCEKVTLD